MNRDEYLVAALKAGCYKKKAWIFSVFSLIKEDTQAYLKDPYPYRIVHMPNGYFFINPESNELELINDAIVTEPLFTFLQPLSIDSSVCKNALQPTETVIGNVLFNLCCIIPAFGTKIPFLTRRIDIGKIEDLIASKLQDTPKIGEPRSENVFYVDEYVNFVDSLAFIEGLAQITIISTTKKSLTKPPGLEEFKAQLIKEYGERLKDPSVLFEFEKRLSAFDEEYLKDDPTNGKFLSGKVKDKSRKKIILTFGAEAGFDEDLEVRPVINSLSEGWPQDKEQFADFMNASRAGSFSRGAETVKGGVAAKALLRAAGNMKIVDTDCGTKIGLIRFYNKSTIKFLVGRSVLLRSEWKEIETIDEANGYIGKDIIVRSPMYCKLEGEAICKYCAGRNLSHNPTGIPMALTEISNIFLTTSLKKMHGSVLAMAKIDKTTAFT